MSGESDGAAETGCGTVRSRRALSGRRGCCNVKNWAALKKAVPEMEYRLHEKMGAGLERLSERMRDDHDMRQACGPAFARNHFFTPARDFSVW